MNELRKNDLTKSKKLYRLIDYFNAINDVEKLESNYCDIYSEDIELVKEIIDRHETRSFLELEIKISDGKFQVDLLYKRPVSFFYC